MIYWDVNNHTSNVGGHIEIIFYYTVGGEEELYSQVSPLSIGHDKNVVLPNRPGRVAIRVTGGGSSSNSIAQFDNFRYQRYPLIELVGKAFSDHITENEEFYLQVDYASGASCTVTEISSGTTYTASSIGGDKYRTNAISFGISSPAISSLKRFKVSCDGIENTDPRWKVRVNQHEIIADGTFDKNCSGVTCTHNFLGLSGKRIGSDWNATADCSSSVTWFRIDTDYDIATDGNRYGSLHVANPPVASCNYAQIRNEQTIIGGKLFWDVNSHTSNVGATLQVRYDYNSGGSITLYNQNSSQTVGIDKNVDLPNVPGKVVFRLSGGGSSSDSTIKLDNIRYYSPKFSDNSLCRQIEMKGDPTNKIDLVFIGSGFEDQNQFESTIRFVIDYDGDKNGLFSFEPFKTYKNKFNIWMVDEYDTYQIKNNSGNWSFGDEVWNRATTICPYYNEVAFLSVTPRFRSYVRPDIIPLIGYPTGNGTHISYTTVGCEVTGDCNFPLDVKSVDPYNSLCQGSGSYGDCNVFATNPSEISRMFSHEFGHSFSGLWDEYYTGKTASIGDGGLANCEDTAPVCPKWSSISGTGCFQPCGFNNWYRAYDTNTLMGSHFGPRLEYREVNENKIESDLQNYPTATFADLLNSFYTFFLDVSLNGNNLSYTNGEIVAGLAPEIPTVTSVPYKLKLISDSNTVLYDYNFNISKAFLFEPSIMDNNGILVAEAPHEPYVNVNDINARLSVPYFPSAKTILITDENGNSLLSISTASILNQIDYITGNGGNSITSSNFKQTYTITNQPTTILSSANYKMKLGWDFYYD